MSAVAIIPARGGSRRVPRKNIREFRGKPIIAYSIEKALESKLFDEVFVSTEDDEIAQIAVSFGAKWHPRAASYALNDVGTREVTRNAVSELWPANPPDYVCCIYATAPLMDVFDLRRGYHAVQVPGISHAISVGYPPLQDAAQFYWSRVSSLFAGVEYFDSRTTLIDVRSERICDINTEQDWSVANQMAKMLNIRGNM